jgi:hypothetical protein
MTNPTIVPPFVLRQYIFAVLKANDSVWNESNYGGKMPIVPLGEEADLEQYSGPTIVYEWTDLRVSGTLYARGRATMTLGLRDTNFRRLTRSLNVLREALGRFDESARDVNGYLAQRGEPWNDFGFGSISIGFVDGGSPATTENGEVAAVISFDFDYFVDYDVITQPGV